MKTAEQELIDLGFEIRDKGSLIFFDDINAKKNGSIYYFTYDKEYNVFGFDMYEQLSPKEIEILYRYCKERNLI